MATKRKGTGAKDRRVTFINRTPSTQDEFGGGNSGEPITFEMWANIQDRTGNSFNAFAQEQWSYDARVQIRFNPKVTSQTVVVYENNRYKIEAMTPVSEGYKAEMILRCSKTETLIEGL